MVNNFTALVLNEKRNYPIEKQCRMLASLRGSYVIAVLDCCREKLPEATRGTGEDVNIDEGDEPGRDFNFIVTYGCPPSDGTPAKSTISQAYF